MRTLAIAHQRDSGPGVFAEAIAAAGHELDLWHIAETAEPPSDPLSYGAVMTFGGSMHVDHTDGHPWLEPEVELLARLLEARVPVLGVCLGSQLLALAGGGSAVRASEPEIGWYAVELTDAGRADPLLGELAPGFDAFQWHSYECVPPAGAELLARSPVCVQAYRLDGPAWGIQFHAEVSASDVEVWIGEVPDDEDAQRIRVDESRLRAETATRVAGWNELGRALCRRFLAAAEAYSPVSGVR
jgi:GMP synthase-like glutamine amidotransferase